MRGAPGLSEVFADGVSAVLASSTPEAYARDVHRLCADPQRARALGAEASKQVERVERTVQQVVGLYREVAALRRHSTCQAGRESCIV